MRIMRILGGETFWVEVPRFHCSNPACKRYHTGLPEQLTPHKHYATDVIQDIVDDIITADVLNEEDQPFPSEATIVRWHKWLAKNMLFMEGYLNAIISSISELIHNLPVPG